MLSRPLLALLVLAGVVVAAVQLRVQDSDALSENIMQAQVPVQCSTQTALTSASVDLPFGTGPLQSNFEPVGELSTVKSGQWTTLRHPAFPRYSVRIKQSRFCDTTVK
jgi:hypothetical protein